MPPAPRLSAILALFLFSLSFGASAAVPTPEALHRRYRIIRVDSTQTSAYLETVTARFESFVLADGAFSAGYSVDVFPLFFYSERGRVVIPISDDDLRRVDRGETIDFHGSGVNEAGHHRHFDGQLIPTGRAGGRITIRVRVSQRIGVPFNSTWSIRATGTR